MSSKKDKPVKPVKPVKVFSPIARPQVFRGVF